MFLKRGHTKNHPEGLGPHSITGRLILLYSLSTAVLLAAAFGILYYAVAKAIDQEDQALLRDKFREVSADLVAHPPAKPPGIYDLLDRVDLGSRTYLVRILDTKDKLLGENSGMEKVLPASIFPAPSEGKSESMVTTDRAVSGRWFLLLSGWITTAGPETQRFLVQVAQDRSGDRRFLQTFLRILGGVLVSGISAAVLIGWLVARRGLKPVEELTAAVHRVESTKLHERVATYRWPNELTALASAFDAMLSRLEDAFKRLTQFAADLAHELRTPISNLRGETEIMLSRRRTADEYQEAFLSRMEELERLSSMIESLLFIASAQNPESQIKRTSVDGHNAVRSMLDFYEAMAGEQNVELSVSGNVVLQVEPTLFRRALSNLISNALNHTPAGGKIEVRLSTEQGWSQVEVRDSGSGIKAKHLPFDRFFRAEESRHTKGTGLGLSIVKSIMDLHGGIGAIDSTENHGTIVTLRFPSREYGCGS
jgi:two-component system heavy metal sensor histidine kinase CusS